MHSLSIKKLFAAFIVLTFLLSTSISAQYDIYETFDLSKVKSEKTDNGKMWTFDDLPLQYFSDKYGFTPDEDWANRVQKSALQFGGGCSAAFVSADGLIMTNHHCGRGQLYTVQKEGENLLRDGFYAPTIQEERQIPDLYVDQLIIIEDVTDEIIEAFNSGNTGEEKLNNKQNKIKEIETNYSEDTGLLCRVVTLFNGGKYSLYGYKRYTDIRLVMSPDFQIAATGWDWDNFTYPRYELDFAFYRAYDENGKPVTSENHFTWSKKGAEENELIFTVGRPGNTDRLLSLRELEFYRDYQYPFVLNLYNEVYKVYFELFEKYPERESELLNRVMGYGNGRKSYAGRLVGLKDEHIMARKKHFEELLKTGVNSNPELKAKYGHVWEGLTNSFDEASKIYNDYTALRLYDILRPYQYTIAGNLLHYAKQLQLPEDERGEDINNSSIEEYVNKLYEVEADEEYNNLLINAHVGFVGRILDDNHDMLKLLENAQKNDLFKKSLINNKEKIIELLEDDPSSLSKLDDPFVKFFMYSTKRTQEVAKQINELYQTVDVLNQLLGEATFAVFGNSISPDATSTLRLSDGVIAGYEYNGTIAPGKTTYYGLWDRFYSFNQKTYPWGLHERWQKIPAELDLSIPIGFASTNDIVGGNSGSSVINTKGEVVGLVHDGNLESLSGHFIFLEVNNRTVATDSYGLMEALKYVFKSDNLVKELETGKL